MRCLNFTFCLIHGATDSSGPRAAPWAALWVAVPSADRAGEAVPTLPVLMTVFQHLMMTLPNFLSCRGSEMPSLSVSVSLCLSPFLDIVALFMRHILSISHVNFQWCSFGLHALASPAILPFPLPTPITYGPDTSLLSLPVATLLRGSSCSNWYQPMSSLSCPSHCGQINIPQLHPYIEQFLTHKPSKVPYSLSNETLASLPPLCLLASSHAILFA